MTIQNCFDGIIEALYQEFGAGYEIYIESVEQGLKEPCFLLSCLSHERELHVSRLYERSNLFSIQYFPSTINKQEEFAAVSERLYDCLEYITVAGRLLRGQDLKGEPSDDILTFTARYDLFVLKQQEKTMMSDLELITETKG
ncbi:MAG: hypothetical protein J6A26_07245 [Oscillospiraceae bacterium]|nr:hypothetical protein [Oscillospiraceae bacterium]